MKRLLLSVFFLTVLVASANGLRPYASIPTKAENICLSSTYGIMAAAESTMVLMDDFKGTLEAKWTKPLNDGSIVTFKTGVMDGRQAMIWINEKAQDIPYDTETAIGSKPFSVADLFELRLDYVAKSTVGSVLRKNIIHYDNYDFKICWYKADEAKPFHEDTFDCETTQEKFVPNHHVFIVPEGASMATLHFGFGKPNFQKGQFFAVADFQLLGFGKNGRISPNASFETVPTRLYGNDFAFDGMAPNGATLQFLFSYAPDDGGAPGKWSAWSPELSADSKLMPPPNSAWIKVKAVMTSSGKRAASVKSITVGKRMIGNWKTLMTPSQPDATLASVSPAKPDTPVKFRINASSDINWKASTLVLDGKDAKGAFITNPLEDDGVYILTPKTPLSAGVHGISLHLVTMDGASLDKTIVFFVGGRAETAPKVTIRHDGLMLIDGEPFFPIGLSYLKAFEGNNFNLDTMFADLRRRGFNYGAEASMRAPNYQPALDYAAAAERQGFRIQLCPGLVTTGANTSDILGLAKGVAALRDCKAVLLWDMGDDTSTYNTPENMRNKHDAIRAVDPDRATVQADLVGDFSVPRYKPYVNATEVFKPEIYPVHSQNSEASHANCVFRAIADMDLIAANKREVATGPRGALPIIQYFASKENEGNAWEFPTPAENRAMVYASIIRGATGITWYSYARQVRYHSAGATPGKLDDLTVIAQELNALYDVLTAEPIPQSVELKIIVGAAKDERGRAPVYILLKRSEKRTVLFTVNASVNDVTARIALSGVTRATELFPTAEVKLTQPGILDIPFTRHQVRVFELK